jgi:hypothetical protein
VLGDPEVAAAVSDSRTGCSEGRIGVSGPSRCDALRRGARVAAHRRQEVDMRGVITRMDVLVHSRTIVKLFGWRAYVRCLRAAFSPAPTTFLATVFAYARPPTAAGAERSRTTR